MKKLIIFFLILLLAIALGLFMHADAGYVLIAYKTWTIETTLWAALLAILILFILLYLFTVIIRGFFSIPTKIQKWSKHVKLNKNRILTNLGLCKWIEGDFQSAENKLIKAAKNSTIPLINYLAAAHAAQEQGKYDKRDSYLCKAYKSTPNAEIAVGLTQAQLQLTAGQLEMALATLKRLRQLAPHHAYIIRLLQQVYRELHDWKSLKELLPILQKYKIFNSEKLKKLEKDLYLELLDSKTLQNITELKKLWADIPSVMQNDPELLSVYVSLLIKNGENEIAEQLLHNAIKNSWNSKLVRIYATATVKDLTKQLVTAESWLKNHSDDPALFLCLGQLCRKAHLWGKAKSYLETCITLGKNKTAYFELGQIMEKLGNETIALNYYRRGLNAEN